MNASKAHINSRNKRGGGVIGIIHPEIEIKATKAAWISKLSQNKSNLSKFLNTWLAYY